MTNQDVKAGDTVSLVWHDSASKHGWVPIPTRLDFGIIRSVGVIVSVSSIQIEITHSTNDEGSVFSPMAIPWTCIKEIKVLERPV